MLVHAHVARSVFLAATDIVQATECIAGHQDHVGLQQHVIVLYTGHRNRGGKFAHAGILASACFTRLVCGLLPQLRPVLVAVNHTCTHIRLVGACSAGKESSALA